VLRTVCVRVCLCTRFGLQLGVGAVRACVRKRVRWQWVTRGVRTHCCVLCPLPQRYLVRKLIKHRKFRSLEGAGAGAGAGAGSGAGLPAGGGVQASGLDPTTGTVMKRNPLSVAQAGGGM
jgi:hypothetical protein